MSKTAISTFYCLSCFNATPLPRRKSRMREESHLKKLYCFKCRNQYNHFEVREFDLSFSINDLKRKVRDGEYDVKPMEE